jgi:FkbM family methyltransferase
MNGRISMRSAVSTLLEQFPLQRQTYSSLRTSRHTGAAYRKLPFLGVFPVRIDENTSFQLQSYGSAREADLFRKGLYVHEPTSLRLWVRLCRRSSVIFDVGADLGLYGLVAAAANPKARVFAFEPLQHLNAMLVRNADLNSFPNLRCERLALGNAVGSTNVFFSPSHVASGPLTARWEAQKQTVPLTTITRFVRDPVIKQIDLLKITVEGAEPDVLDGMEDLLYRTTPPMIVDVMTDEIGARLERMLSPAYLYFHIDEEAGVAQKHRIQRLSAKSKKYFFCPTRSAEEILPLLKEI